MLGSAWTAVDNGPACIGAHPAASNAAIAHRLAPACLSEKKVIEESGTIKYLYDTYLMRLAIATLLLQSIVT
ncbi:hypothetical protein [Qipengyuania qiaonensis]|nr:hypothetical protein [Qipengyuania qiaonensis]